MPEAMMNYGLRLTMEQHRQLEDHVLRSDGLEAGALLRCGRRVGRKRHILTTIEVRPIPLAACERTAVNLTWPTDFALDFIEAAAKRGQAVVKVHSHPGGFEHFSHLDDAADYSFLGAVHDFCGDGQPHGSAVMLPGGRMFARALTADGSFAPFDRVCSVGEQISLWLSECDYRPPEFVSRHAQAFGAGTLEQLQRMSAAVIGVSGTGSPLVAELARSGIGRLVLVDPKLVKEANLNRIAFSRHADIGRPKVEVVGDAVRAMGFGTEVVQVHGDVADPDTVQTVAECDILFGCMDSLSGRDILNRIAAFYTLPYIDVGVSLDARPNGGVDAVWASVHYLQPSRSSLRSRGVFNGEEVRAEAMRRNDPDEYAKQAEQQYIRGVQEGRPAVMPLNAFASSVAVLEFFARLHPFRYDNRFALQRFALHDGLTTREAESEFAPCPLLGKYVGQGDVDPILNRPALSGFGARDS